MFEVFLMSKQEFWAFIKSGRSALLLTLITTLVWGGMISSKTSTLYEPTSYLWVIFFALVASATLTNSVFVRERISNNLEVLLVSGLNRSSILWGKLLFTNSVTLFIGVGAISTAISISTLFYQKPFVGLETLVQISLLYFASSLLVNSSSAFLSFALSNPRVVQFVNFTLLTLISVSFTTATIYWRELPLWSLATVMITLSILFNYLALRLFKSEKIIQPLIY